MFLTTLLTGGGWCPSSSRPTSWLVTLVPPVAAFPTPFSLAVADSVVARCELVSANAPAPVVVISLAPVAVSFAVGRMAEESVVELDDVTVVVLTSGIFLVNNFVADVVVVVVAVLTVVDDVDDVDVNVVDDTAKSALIVLIDDVDVVVVVTAVSSSTAFTLELLLRTISMYFLTLPFKLMIVSVTSADELSELFLSKLLFGGLSQLLFD
jgi:hypothetical protein